MNIHNSIHYHTLNDNIYLPNPLLFNDSSEDQPPILNPNAQHTSVFLSSHNQNTTMENLSDKPTTHTAPKTSTPIRISSITSRLWKALSIVSFTGSVIAFSASFVVSSALALTSATVLAVAFLVLLGLQIANKILKRMPQTIVNAANYAKSAATGVVTVTTSAITYPYNYTARNPTAQSPEVIASANSPNDPKTRPILLIHGFLHNSSGWIYHKNHLHSKGYGPIYTINLGSPFLGIEDYAEKVSKITQDIAKMTNRSDLTIIGHSMGGIVATHYAMNLAPKNSVKDIITLGSPFHGSVIATIALISKCARQMFPSSEFLKNFRTQLSKEKSLRFFNLSSDADLLVIPNNSALINAPGCNVTTKTFPDMDHLQYLMSDRVNDAIDLYLKQQQKTSSNTTPAP